MKSMIAMFSQRCCITVECFFFPVSCKCLEILSVVAGASKPSAETTKGWKDSQPDTHLVWYMCHLSASCCSRTFMRSHAWDVALLALLTSIMSLERTMLKQATEGKITLFCCCMGMGMGGEGMANKESCCVLEGRVVDRRPFLMDRVTKRNGLAWVVAQRLALILSSIRNSLYMCQASS